MLVLNTKEYRISKYLNVTAVSIIHKRHQLIATNSNFSNFNNFDLKCNHKGCRSSIDGLISF